jgi:hypothetical protein
MSAIRPRYCPSCGKTLRPRPITHPGCTREIIFECKDCGVSMIEAATLAEVFAAAARCRPGAAPHRQPFRKSFALE